MRGKSQPENLLFARQLSSLPHFGQTLVACRLVRRAALAMLQGADQELALHQCAILETTSRAGKDACWDNSALGAIDGKGSTGDNESVLNALRHAVDAINAALSANAPSDVVRVTSSVQQCIEAVYEDPRISRMQVAIIVNSDIDQIGFACAEAKIGEYDGLTGHVLGRLVPCHALQLFEPSRSIEEEFR